MKVRTKGIAITLGVLAAGWVVFALSGVAGAELIQSTGSGSRITTDFRIEVGAQNLVGFECILTIENGGMVKAAEIRYGVSAAHNVGWIRVGWDGVLAVAGDKTLAEMATVGAGSGGLQYWTGSAWDDILNATPDVHYTLKAGTDDLADYTVLTVIPEPGTIALLGLFGLALFIRRRFVK